MKFKHCRVCKGKMSRTFSYCPQCGGHNPKLGSWSALFVVVLLSLVVVRFSDGYASSVYNRDQIETRNLIIVPIAEPDFR